MFKKNQEAPAEVITLVETKKEELDATASDPIPVDPIPVEETPVEDIPVEEVIPVEETPLEETPLEETPVEEVIPVLEPVVPKPPKVTIVAPKIVEESEVTVIPTVTQYMVCIGGRYYDLEAGKPIKVTRDAKRNLEERDAIK